MSRERPSRRRGASLLLVAATLGASLAATAPLATAESRLDALLARGDERVQLLWARRYQRGAGIRRDYDAAVRLLCAAARNSYADAQYELGWTYANARGVDKDGALASRWFQLAAVQGHRHAARMAARLGAPRAGDDPPCILVDGSEVLRPLVELPDPSRQAIESVVAQLAPEYGLDPTLVLAVIQAESAFNPRALSNKGAQGLMQLIPETANRFGVEDVWDPVQNIRGGMAYLRWLLDHFDGDQTLALAGYNAGEGAVQRHDGVPPYPETRAYVRRVARSMQRVAARGSLN